MASILPVADEGTLGDVGILLGGHHSTVDEVLAEHLVPMGGEGVSIDLVEVSAGCEGQHTEHEGGEGEEYLVHDR